jgi:hypothetical protein
MGFGMSIDDAIATLRTELHEFRVKIETIGNAENGLVSGSKFDEVQSRLNAIFHESVHAFANLEEEIRSATTHLDALHGELENNVANATNSLDHSWVECVHEISNIVPTGVENILTMLVSEIEDWLAATAHTLDTDLASGLDKLVATAHSAMEQLMGLVEAQLHALSQALGNEIAATAKSAVSKVIGGVVDRAMSEVTETVTVTETSATITESIGPYIPEIILVRDSVEAIHAALQALHFGH